MILAKNDTYGYMGKGNYASNIRKLEKSYKSGLTKPNMEGGVLCVALMSKNITIRVMIVGL